MKDGFNREINYIRVSVTDRCNLRCGYCMPPDGVSHFEHSDILTLEEITRLCHIFARLGISRIKITGGEPLVRKGVVPWISQLKKIQGIEQVTMTSNGVALSENIQKLAEGGLDGLNISLDTLDNAQFLSITGTNLLDKVSEGIDKAAQAGLKLKINCVPMRGINEDQIINIARLAYDKADAVRFIEMMPIGLGQNYEGIPAAEIVKMLEAEFGLMKRSFEKMGNGPAQYMMISDFRGKIGFIHAVSQCFCEDCNRVRLTADGKLKLCLASDEGIDLREMLRRGDTDKVLEAEIFRIIKEKPVSHHFGTQKVIGRPMNAIGG